MGMASTPRAHNGATRETVDRADDWINMNRCCAFSPRRPTDPLAPFAALMLYNAAEWWIDTEETMRHYGVAPLGTFSHYLEAQFVHAM